MNDLVSENINENGNRDAAWVTIKTPLSINDLKLFCEDIERLFRINPMLEFCQWKKLESNKYFMSVKNISQEESFDLATELHVDINTENIVINYMNGIKKKTILEFEPCLSGSRLTIIDDYTDMNESVRASCLNEVDKSLTNWADYLQRYLVTWQRWSRFSLWRWYMSTVWLPMKPTGRRIVYIFYWITIVEILFVALVAGIYALNY